MFDSGPFVANPYPIPGTNLEDESNPIDAHSYVEILALCHTKGLMFHIHSVRCLHDALERHRGPLQKRTYRADCWLGVARMTEQSAM